MMRKQPSKRERRNFMRSMRRRRSRRPGEVPNVGPGDVVVFKGTRATAGPDIIVRITEVMPRYGLSDGLPLAPLVIAENVETGEREMFDASLVGEVIERASYTHAKTFNYFRHLRQLGKMTPVTCSRRGEWIGTLEGMALWVLSTLPFAIARELDHTELSILWERDAKPGFRGYAAPSWFIIRVNADVFARWLRRNASKVCKTVVALHLERTQREDENRRDMDADVEMMFRLDEADREPELVGQEEMYDGW